MASKPETFDQLRIAFSHGNFKPLYLFYGEELFLIDELQAILIEKALAPHERDFNLDIIYGAEATSQAVLATCASYPMMAVRRVVIVRDFDKLKENKLFTSFAEHPNPQAIILLICSGKPNTNAHPYKALKEFGSWAEFKPFYENQMAGWLQQRIEQTGSSIEPGAVQMLADYVGTDLRTAATEIEKIITYAGDRNRITENDVISASGQTREFNVFELQKAIGQGKHRDALRISEHMLRQASNSRSEALMIVSFLSGFLTKLWKLHLLQPKKLPDSALASSVGISPYFIKEYLLNLRLFSPQLIDRAFTALLSADYELKGGSSRDEHLIIALMLGRIVPNRS